MPVAARRRPESRKRSQSSQWTAGFGRRRIARPAWGGHSRAARMNGLNHRIPRPSFQTRLYHLSGRSRRRSTAYIPVGVHPCRRACAGMTARAEVRNLSGIAKRLSGWQLACFLLVVIPVCLHRQALESTPPSFMDRKSCMRREGRMPVAARRRPESRKRGQSSQWTAGFGRRRIA